MWIYPHEWVYPCFVKISWLRVLVAVFWWMELDLVSRAVPYPVACFGIYELGMALGTLSVDSIVFLFCWWFVISYLALKLAGLWVRQLYWDGGLWDLSHWLMFHWGWEFSGSPKSWTQISTSWVQAQALAGAPRASQVIQHWRQHPKTNGESNLNTLEHPKNLTCTTRAGLPFSKSRIFCQCSKVFCRSCSACKWILFICGGKSDLPVFLSHLEIPPYWHFDYKFMRYSELEI